MTAIMHHEPGRLAALRRGSTDRGDTTWPSAFLHEIGPSMEDGIDKRRLAAIADFIEGLPMGPERGELAPGPLGTATGVDGRFECFGFVLRPGREGLGTVCFHPHEPHEERRRDPQGYYLSGFGLVCWAWGASQGMSAVADNDHAVRMHDVFIAEPVREEHVPGFTLSDVTPRHVADAIRRFIDCEDAALAWRSAFGLNPEEASEPPAVEPPKPVPARGGATLTLNDTWERLFAADRYGDMRDLSDRRVGELEAERDRLEGELSRVDEDLAKWRKRQKAAASLAAVDDDAGTD